MKITYRNTVVFILSLIAFIDNAAAQNNSKQPNIIIIHTDEHNLRTIGAFRDTMSKEQAEMWGKGNIVETPNIDRLADEGAICTSFYATSPVCTPSRASMVSGMYPVSTGSYKNDVPLNDGLVTFASVLGEHGYATSYVGKWHLDGEGKPGFAPERKFGFDDNRYMFNRGHWKILGDSEEGPFVDQKLNKNGGAEWKEDKANEDNFTTDFLVDRSLEILERDKSKPFCLMISIPDPHGPDQVRSPYNTMYTHMNFEAPASSNLKPGQIPGWLNLKGDKNKIKPKNYQKNMANYFGMVKNIDDNVGRILNFLEKNDLVDNTIVIFTSDHGDQLGEHGKLNKGLPYEMSARVAFLLRYPNKVKKGKHIEKAINMADFGPTILGMSGVDVAPYNFDGEDQTADFFSSKKKVVDGRYVYITNAFGRWVALVNNNYKLVLSPSDTPWLFDLKKDPNELENCYNKPEYAKIAKEMTDELYRQMDQFKEPMNKSNIK